MTNNSNNGSGERKAERSERKLAPTPETTAIDIQLDDLFIPGYMRGYEPFQVTFSGRLPETPDDGSGRVFVVPYPLFKKAINQMFLDYGEAEVSKHLDWWKSDIATGFTPKCSFCGRKTAKVVGQLPRGKSAQENNHRPVNWMYYCQRCYDEGTEREREAMYG